MHILGITGDAGSGKDTVATIIKQVLQDKKLSCQVMSYAYPLYGLLATLFGASIYKLQDRRVKETKTWYYVTQESLEATAELYTKLKLDKYMNFPDFWDKFKLMVKQDSTAPKPRMTLLAKK